jgi:hypothetical protein
VSDRLVQIWQPSFFFNRVCSKVPNVYIQCFPPINTCSADDENNTTTYQRQKGSVVAHLCILKLSARLAKFRFFVGFVFRLFFHYIHCVLLWTFYNNWRVAKAVNKAIFFQLYICTQSEWTPIFKLLKPVGIGKRRFLFFQKRCCHLRVELKRRQRVAWKRKSY